MPDEVAIHEAAPARLPAPSRQKAMDWSLVLASQAIAHFIAPPDENGGWSLRIAAADTSRASASIRQYEKENRAWPWQQPYLEGRIVFDWLALVWVAALITIQALSEGRPIIRESGVMNGQAVSRGEWWRLITATQLHADWGHLASNLSIGFILLGLVMGRWGTATGVLAALLAGAGGNAANWVLYPERSSLGASGVVMGCIGLLALFPNTPGGAPRKIWRGLIGGLAGAAMLFMLLGLDPWSDVLAHAGGFASGLALAALLRRFPALSHARPANSAAAFALLALVMLSWKLALAHANARV
jgi:rhomboid protease GluP